MIESREIVQRNSKDHLWLQFEEKRPIALSMARKRTERIRAIPVQNHLSLAIDCESTQSNNLAFSMNRSFVPDEATEKEKLIHDYLDSFDIHPVNIKQLLEGTKIESPEIRRLFSERRIKAGEDMEVSSHHPALHTSK